jgi:hypothetical protein
VFNVKCGVDGAVKVKNKVEGSAKQLPVCLEIVVSYSRGVGCWLEEDFERYGIVIRGKCGDCFWFG